MDCKLTSEMNLIVSILLLTGFLHQKYCKIQRLFKASLELKSGTGTVCQKIPRLSMATLIFHDFPGLKNSFLKCHDFLGCVGTPIIVLRVLVVIITIIISVYVVEFDTVEWAHEAFWHSNIHRKETYPNNDTNKKKQKKRTKFK